MADHYFDDNLYKIFCESIHFNWKLFEESLKTQIVIIFEFRSQRKTSIPLFTYQNLMNFLCRIETKAGSE